jgi:hypothetical protein
MTTLKVHTIESAPEASKPLLEGSQKAYGMIQDCSVLARRQIFKIPNRVICDSSFNNELTVVGKPST